jgi:hypothetical protein
VFRKPFVAAVLLGTIAGTLILGIGGRAAMRAYSLITEDIPYFTMSGSTTVVLAGAAAGFVCGVALWAGYRFVRGPGLRRQLLFWIALAALTARVLQPWSTLRLQVFVPLALIYGLATIVPWHLTAARRIERSGDAGQSWRPSA